MSVIEASSGTYRSRVDGTIVLSVEIEPRYRAEALALFGMPGTPMALAALKVQSAKPREVGELCQWVAIRCGEPRFRTWLKLSKPSVWAANETPGTSIEEVAAATVRDLCGVSSRTEIDGSPAASAALHADIRLPYAAWLKKQAVAC